MVATNAGGLHVVKHGSMRAQVLGVQAVLGTGELVEANLAGLLKDNTGYDLPGLLCGSEGTLGIVTAARLRLVPTPAGRLVALLGMASVAEAVAALPVLRALPSLHAVELLLESGLAVVGDHLGAPSPVVGGCAVLVEVAGERAGLADELGVALDRLGDAVLSSAVADDPTGIARLWRWREAHSEAAASLGLVHKADVTLPVTELAVFVARVEAAVSGVAPGSTTLVFGHLADGNLHVNIVGPPPDDDRPVDAVLDLVLELGGSVSAEHGIGTAKREWLVRQRGESAVAAMRAIKAALDPDGILNPRRCVLLAEVTRSLARPQGRPHGAFATALRGPDLRVGPGPSSGAGWPGWAMLEPRRAWADRWRSRASARRGDHPLTSNAVSRSGGAAMGAGVSVRCGRSPGSISARRWRLAGRR